jgi:DNA-binding transcriptional LysR family regulator
LAGLVPSHPPPHYAKIGGLVVLKPDVGLPPFTVSLHWYWRVHNDPGNRWLRELILELYQETPRRHRRAAR